MAIGLLLSCISYQFCLSAAFSQAKNDSRSSSGSSNSAVTTTTTTTTATNSGRVIYEVCLSPGCIADGAEATFSKLQAIAPAGVEIKKGDCCSLCGNGPIVMCPNKKTTTVKHRKVKGQKIMQLLMNADTSNDSGGVDEKDDAAGARLQLTVPEELIQGYEMSVEAEDALKCKDYEHAISLYERAINTAFRSALDVQMAREKAEGKALVTDSTGIPIGLVWMVKARRNEAIARMALGDLDGAVLAAQGSCNIGRNRCPQSLETLAEIYEKRGDKAEELQALNNLFELKVDADNMSRQEENKRRELGFRRDKLQRELS